MCDGGIEVGYADALIDDFLPFVIGFAIDLAAFDAASGEEAGEGVGVVIAAVVGIYFRCASEFGADDDECFFEESPGNEGRRGEQKGRGRGGSSS